VHWQKEAEDGSHCPWLSIVESLDATRDVLLFPSPDATFAEEFDWGSAPTSGDPDQRLSGGVGRYRLVVLEATWNHAKWISKQITAHRKAKGLAPLRCVALKGVVGQYWRFHEEGHSALSTIEAIAYTASAAGMSDGDVDSLLTLFRVQKGRVLLSVDRGEKVPRAMCVGGIGDGSWDNVHIANPR
jgi:DTW domain-containing protein YfiP